MSERPKKKRGRVDADVQNMYGACVGPIEGYGRAGAVISSVVGNGRGARGVREAEGEVEGAGRGCVVGGDAVEVRRMLKY
jgi:hypothetical protein